MTMKIAHSLTAQGWCECDIHIDNQRVRVSGVYKNKRCKDLSDAAQFLLNGGICSQCVLSNPDGDNIIMLKRDGAWLHLKIIALDEPYSNNANIQGRVLLEEKTSLVLFADCLNTGVH